MVLRASIALSLLVGCGSVTAVATDGSSDESSNASHAGAGGSETGTAGGTGAAGTGGSAGAAAGVAGVGGMAGAMAGAGGSAGGAAGASGSAGSVGGRGGSDGGRPDASMDAVTEPVDVRPTTDDAGKKLPGIACGGDGECGTGFCRQGVCCKTVCADPTTTGLAGHACVACNVPGKEGTCSPLPVGAPAPAMQCFMEYRAVCGQDGTCDGQGGCRDYGPTTMCNTNSYCDGHHNCVAH